MDLQNVSDINIPEGDVRTIHDKNSRLLWGKLSYDTKYAGNTIQDGSPTPDAPVPIQTVTGTQTVTVCGKNLFNKKSTPTFRYQGVCSEIDTGVRITCNSSSSYSYAIFVYDVSSYIGETVTLSADVSVSASNIPRISIGTCDASGGNRTQKVQNTNTGYVSVSYTIASSDRYIFINFSSNAGGTATTGDYIDYKNAQFEIGSVTAYEPYQSHDYIVDLGTLELCKLGDYQDYIYKSGDDWYLHKDINREDLDGSSDEQWVHQTGGSDTYHNWYQHNFAYSSVSDGNVRKLIISNNFTNVGDINYQTTTEGMGTLIGNVRFRWNMGEIDNATKWRAFLGEHPTTVYYMMDTPIETQIADATLISQLDAIHQFLTRYGYNSTVSGNLPLIISKTNL